MSCRADSCCCRFKHGGRGWSNPGSAEGARDGELRKPDQVCPQNWLDTAWAMTEYLPFSMQANTGFARVLLAASNELCEHELAEIAATCMQLLMRCQLPQWDLRSLAGP